MRRVLKRNAGLHPPNKVGRKHPHSHNGKRARVLRVLEARRALTPETRATTARGRNYTVYNKALLLSHREEPVR
jgi:hypothetical protein